MSRPLLRSPAPRFVASFANSLTELREIQFFRYRVFAGELGARINDAQMLDRDHFDKYCRHLVIRDALSGTIAAYSRLLSRDDAQAAGGYYSNGEFIMDNVLALPGEIVEIGRTCVSPEYRDGSAIIALWSALADYVKTSKVDYLIGCASIAMPGDSTHVHAIMTRLRNGYFTDDNLRVHPALPIPPSAGTLTNVDAAMPPLLKSYLRVGAKVCGDAYWDEDFLCADVFILLKVADLSRRYERHFLGRTASA